jgi:hypothetical protein
MDGRNKWDVRMFIASRLCIGLIMLLAPLALDTPRTLAFSLWPSRICALLSRQIKPLLATSRLLTFV